MSSSLSVESVNAALALREDQDDLSKVKFAYDYLEPVPEYIKAPEVANDPMVRGYSATEAENSTFFSTKNSLALDPILAGLPWHTGLRCTRQAKSWKGSQAVFNELLELVARDETANEAVKANGKSPGGIAAHELTKMEQDRFATWAAYLWPEADESRLRLLAASLAYLLLFDDAWEMIEGEALKKMVDDFLSLLEDEASLSRNGDLQALLSSMVTDIHQHDRQAGDGGREVIETIVQFGRRDPPPKSFNTLDDYLRFRWDDVGMPYMLAAAKFSVASNVEIRNSRLENFLRLACHHMIMVNDLASYDKEKKDFDQGQQVHLVNAVEVIKRVLSLPTETSAQALVYAMQLQNEAEIDRELSRMRAENVWTGEEWKFANAVLTMLAGNVFYSVISSRYGGESARLED